MSKGKYVAYISSAVPEVPVRLHHYLVDLGTYVNVVYVGRPEVCLQGREYVADRNIQHFGLLPVNVQVEMWSV